MHVKSRIFRTAQLLFLCILTFSILQSPAKACSYAALALKLWFEKMIPSLFPFMVLSGLIVRLNFSRTLSRPVYPFLGRTCRISRTMCTTLFLGFLFGFPLGAKTVAEQYRFGQLTKPEAQYLLTFCNNIGPVYLLSFALPLLGLSGSANLLKSAVLFIYFGTPLLYGLILRYTKYRKESFPDKLPDKRPDKPSAPLSFISALDDSVTSACAAVTRLGGYMVFFMVCNILTETKPVFAVIFEITSGLSLTKDLLPPPFLLTMLTFGGLSCFAQTYTCIRETDLSFGNYCFHKFFQTAIVFCFYTLLFSVSVWQ